MMIDREWLEEINNKLSADNVPIHQRAIQAVLHWHRATGECRDLLDGYPEVYAFFKEMGSPQEPLVEFRGAFFFGGEFWPLIFPRTYGIAVIDVATVIANMSMPPAETRRLMCDQQLRVQLASVIGSCLDWIQGFPCAGSAAQLSFADENLSATDR